MRIMSLKIVNNLVKKKLVTRYYVKLEKFICILEFKCFVKIVSA